ncbi:MAG: hypothetical protein H7841_01275 [Magnetospirillum sp. WYHS-4]
MRMDLLKIEAIDIPAGAGGSGGDLPAAAAAEIGGIMAAGRVVMLPDRLKKPRFPMGGGESRKG